MAQSNPPAGRGPTRSSTSAPARANQASDYLSLYSRVGGIVANRVHAAICVAGFGRPAVVIGNDSRIGIARPVGVPAIDSSHATSEWIVNAIDGQMDRRDELLEERLSLREDSARRYSELIREQLSSIRDTRSA